MDRRTELAIERAEWEASQAPVLEDWTPPPPPPHCPVCGLVFKAYARQGMTQMQINRHKRNAHEALWYGKEYVDGIR